MLAQSLGTVRKSSSTVKTKSKEEVAKQLHVHPNTVRHRLKQAEGLLDKALELPAEKIVFGLAALAYLKKTQSPTLG